VGFTYKSFIYVDRCYFYVLIALMSTATNILILKEGRYPEPVCRQLLFVGSLYFLMVFPLEGKARPFYTRLDEHGKKANVNEALAVPFQDNPQVAGLKECLMQGVERAVEELSRIDGYFARSEIRIPLPPEAESAANKLRSLGQSKRVDDMILSLNRAAEGAAHEAKTLFVDAIRQLKPADAIGIVRGGDDGATRYLRSQTEDALVDRFSPAIDASLQQSGAADKWKSFVGVYNRIPGVRRLDTDLTRHVCQRAVAGLFVRVAEEEKAIRTQPARRTSELLRNVFGRP
jgi:hypothetical protein